MSQSTNQGAIPDGSGASVRAAININDLALCSQNEGSGTPAITHPFMVWRNNTSKFIYQRNAGDAGWEILQNYGATTDPTTGDDTADGYIRGSIWINTTLSKYWVCTNPTGGAAIWREISTASGSTQAFGTITVAGQSDIVADAAPDGLTLVASPGITLTTNATTDTLTIAPNFGTATGTVCQGNDVRLGVLYLPINVKNAPYSAVGNNSTDDTAAIAAAAADAVSLKRPLYFPAGDYKMTAALAMNNAPVEIFGDGIGLSRITWTSGASTRGISLTANADRQFQGIHDLSFCTAGASVGTALKFDFQGEITSGFTQRRTRQRFFVDNCEFVGSSADLSDTSSGWLVGISALGAIDSAISNCQVTGQVDPSGVGYKGTVGTIGIHLGKSASGGEPCQVVLDNCTLNHLQWGAIFDDTFQGGYVHHCNFVIVGTGVYAIATDTYPQIQIDNSHINCYDHAVYLYNMTDCNINNNLFYYMSDVTSNSIIYLGGTSDKGCDRFLINNNNIGGSTSLSTGAGITIDAADTGVIGGNIFVGYVSAMNVGINLTAGASHVNGTMNTATAGGVTHAFINAGTNNIINGHTTSVDVF